VISSQTIPIIAIAPLLLIWVGYGITPKVIIVALISFYPITKEELPRVFLTHQPDEKTERAAAGAKFGQGRGYGGRSEGSRSRKTEYVGPFVDGKAVKRTLRILRRIFPYYTASKHPKRPCQYCNLGLCPGPDPDKKAYEKNIKSLTAILEGKKTSVVKKLQVQMKQTSKTQDFEQAANLRDQLHDLEVIFSHARIFRPEPEKQPIAWPPIEAYLQKILGTTDKISRAEAYDISNTQGIEATGSMPVFIDGMPTKQHYRKFKIRNAGKPNDFAMLEETISRRLKHKEWDYPDLIIIDGGKGQLSAALKAIEKNIATETQPSQILQIKVAAIAKRNNELFLPGKSKPLLLRDMPREVSNFILHMRDEAHRFAISYHRLLRKKSLTKAK